MASCQYCRRAFSRSECKVAMWSLATLNMVLGLMGVGSLGSALASSLALALALGTGVGGGGGGVGGSSMMRVLGFLGA